MSNFLEERFPVDVRLGMSYADDYTVLITTTAGGAEYRKLVQPFPVRSFHVNVTTDQADLWARVLALYHRAYGKFAGFRVKCLDDFSTNGLTGTPTPTDEVLANSATGIYQLRNFYGTNGTPLAGVGYPWRNLYKPVAGTVVAARNGVTSRWAGSLPDRIWSGPPCPRYASAPSALSSIATGRSVGSRRPLPNWSDPRTTTCG